MEVKITFDTEKECVEDLKKLVVALQDLIARKEKDNVLSENKLQQVQQQTTFNSTVKEQPKSQTSGQTSSGGRVIPYEDISSLLSKIVSRQKY